MGKGNMFNLKEIENKTDEDLVKLSLENEEYFGYIINRYEKKLLRYISRITNINQEELHDILQDTFISAYYNLNGFDMNLKFSSWIYRIAHNKVISTHRKNKVRPHGNLVQIEDDVLKNIADDFDIKKEGDIKYLRKHIDSTLDTMDSKYKEVLVLRFLEEKDYREISDILKKPMGTVAVLLSRAKKKFRAELSKQNIDLYYE
jgi:RNA polymerase sigma-70 factor (ECF subfamily)